MVTGEPIQLLGPIEAQDRWEGYQAERTELLSFINSNHLDNVVFVKADLHALIVNNLTYATAPGRRSATQAFEVVVPAAAYDAPLGPVVVELLAAAGAITPARWLFRFASDGRQGRFVRALRRVPRRHWATTRSDLRARTFRPLSWKDRTLPRMISVGRSLTSIRIRSN